MDVDVDVDVCVDMYCPCESNMYEEVLITRSLCNNKNGHQ